MPKYSIDGKIIPYRFLSLKSRRLLSFILRLLVLLIICYVFYDKIIRKHHWQRRTVIVQDDLLDYNEDDLRSGPWPFQIDKHYDVHETQPYVSKRKIIATEDQPGERGTPVRLSPILEDLSLMSFGEYQLNIVASDRVSQNRSLPDLRDPKCLDIRYPKRLPTATGKLTLPCTKSKCDPV